MLLTVVVGNVRKRTEQEIQSDREYARALAQSKQFGLLVEDTADRLVREWDHAETAQGREVAHFKLEGLKALVKELQIKADQGSPS